MFINSSMSDVIADMRGTPKERAPRIKRKPVIAAKPVRIRVPEVKRIKQVDFPPLGGFHPCRVLTDTPVIRVRRSHATVTP